MDKALEFNYKQHFAIPNAKVLPNEENWSIQANGSVKVQQSDSELDTRNDQESQETIDNICVSQGIHPREINLFLGYSWELESKIKCSRKTAEAMAGELLERSSPPLTSEVLQILNMWKFKSNPYRKNVMEDDWKFVYSDCFGMSVSRTQQLGVSTNSRNSNSIDHVILKWMWATYPEEMSKHSFTSVTLNSNFSARIHRDRNNSGLSLITAIGNYTGGNLLYWEDDDNKMSLDEVSKHEPQVVDLKDQLFIMNGKCAHAVEAFEGTR